jgi:hypothetical protein
LSAGVLSGAVVGGASGGRRRHINRDGLGALRNGEGALRKCALREVVCAVCADGASMKGDLCILWGRDRRRGGLNIRSQGVITLRDGAAILWDRVGVRKDPLRRRLSERRSQSDLCRGLFLVGRRRRRGLIPGRSLIFRRLERFALSGRFIGRL